MNRNLILSIGIFVVVGASFWLVSQHMASSGTDTQVTTVAQGYHGHHHGSHHPAPPPPPPRRPYYYHPAPPPPPPVPPYPYYGRGYYGYGGYYRPVPPPAYYPPYPPRGRVGLYIGF